MTTMNARINDRAQMTAGSINDLPDSAFAYIEPGGTKDASGKTAPRSLRHFPVHDAAHTRNALARLSQSPFGDKAKAKVMAAATKFGIDKGSMRASDVPVADANPPAENLAGQYEPANVAELQSMIAELASEPSIHQNSDVAPVRNILDKLIAAAKRLNAVALIPPAWNANGTQTIAPRGWTGELVYRDFSIGEVREQSDGRVTMSGYGSTFNDPYNVRDKYGEFDETILPGAWAKSIANRDSQIHLLMGHDSTKPLAATPTSLRLWEDSHGLGFEGDLFPRESPLQQEAAFMVRNRLMTQMSVGMRVPEGGDRWSDNNSQRAISQADLIEVSVLTRGANGNTQAMMREESALAAEIRQLRESLAAHTGITLDAAQRMLAAHYEQTATAAARRALLDAMR